MSTYFIVLLWYLQSISECRDQFKHSLLPFWQGDCSVSTSTFLIIVSLLCSISWANLLHFEFSNMFQRSATFWLNTFKVKTFCFSPFLCFKQMFQAKKLELYDKHTNFIITLYIEKPTNKFNLLKIYYRGGQ